MNEESMQPYTRYQDIPQFTKRPPYSINVGFDYLPEWLESQEHESIPGFRLDLDPPFQRAHVWTEAQQIAFVEFCLRGGRSGMDLYFNCPSWMKQFNTPLVLVDGKQRLEAVRRFLADDLIVFGSRLSDFTDRLRTVTGAGFVISINDLQTDAEVLKWYLEMNSGGTPHTEAELDKVRSMLADEPVPHKTAA